jgi:H+-translocating NAD(P) transhydrogenase subunit alpha
VTILCPTDLVSRKPFHASQMYSKNVETFLKALVSEGEVVINLEDEITAGTLLCRGR